MARSQVDRRTPEAVKYRRLYKTARWQSLRHRRLKDNPLCQRCEANGFVVPATAVNHITPHKGDPELFWSYANTQSVCSPCHDGPIQAAERTGRDNGRSGYRTEVLGSGMPTDRRHPFFADGGRSNPCEAASAGPPWGRQLN